MKVMQAFSWLALSIFSIQGVVSLKLNVTAIGAQDGSSTLECWQVDQPFNVSTEPGTSGSAQVTLGGVETLSYSIIPSQFDGGIHNAPHNQWVVFTSGLAYITLPNDEATSAYVVGGEFGLIFAGDTAAVSTVGHHTQYPGVTETIALQIPTTNGEIPSHCVLHMGSCTAEEVSGIRGLASAA
ncbi:hypothetical protein F4778DRAFT_749022 [Xylariomycetidae sp. FL2044]|nr:hypothetical protein F4778DRAFT_749022 [Xylariomycetidae sp. FL2044]